MLFNNTLPRFTVNCCETLQMYEAGSHTFCIFYVNYSKHILTFPTAIARDSVNAIPRRLQRLFKLKQLQIGLLNHQQMHILEVS